MENGRKTDLRGRCRFPAVFPGLGSRSIALAVHVIMLLCSNEGFKIVAYFCHDVSKGSYPFSKPTQEDFILAYTLFHCSWRKARAQRARYMRERSERHVSSDF